MPGEIVFKSNSMRRPPPRVQPVRASTACTARCQASQAASAAAPARSAAWLASVQPPAGLLPRRAAAVLGRGAGAAEHRLGDGIGADRPARRIQQPPRLGQRGDDTGQRRPPRRLGRQPFQHAPQGLQAARAAGQAAQALPPRRCRASAAAPGRRARHPRAAPPAAPRAPGEAQRGGAPSSMASGAGRNRPPPGRGIAAWRRDGAAGPAPAGRARRAGRPPARSPPAARVPITTTRAATRSSTGCSPLVWRGADQHVAVAGEGDDPHLARRHRAQSRHRPARRPASAPAPPIDRGEPVGQHMAGGVGQPHRVQRAARRQVLHPPDPLGRQRGIEEGQVGRLAGAQDDRRRQGEGDPARRGGGLPPWAAPPAAAALRAAALRRSAGAGAMAAIGAAAGPGGGRYRPPPPPVPRCGPAAPAAAPGSAHRSPARRPPGCRRPATAAPPSQSAPERFSTTAQPCSRASPFPFGQHQPPGGLPERRGGDIGQRHLAWCGRPGQGDLQPPYIGAAAGRQGLRRAGQAGGQRPGPAAVLPRPRRAPARAGRSGVSSESRSPPSASSAPASRPLAPPASTAWPRSARNRLARVSKSAGRTGRPRKASASRSWAGSRTAPAWPAGVAQQQGFQHVVDSLDRDAEADRLPGRQHPGAVDLHQPGIGEGDAAHRRVCREGREGRQQHGGEAGGGAAQGKALRLVAPEPRAAGHGTNRGTNPVKNPAPDQAAAAEPSRPRPARRSGPPPSPWPPV